MSNTAIFNRLKHEGPTEAYATALTISKTIEANDRRNYRHEQAQGHYDHIVKTEFCRNKDLFTVTIFDETYLMTAIAHHLFKKAFVDFLRGAMLFSRSMESFDIEQFTHIQVFPWDLIKR